MSGKPIKAVQVGGPLGAYLPESQFDTPLDYEKFSEIWAVLGHGGIVAFDDTDVVSHTQFMQLDHRPLHEQLEQWDAERRTRALCRR